MLPIWRNQNQGSAQMIGVVVALLVSIAVGVLVWYKLSPSLISSMGYSASSSTALNTTKTVFGNVNTTANTIWTLFPIVGVVLIAGIILAIVTNFGRGSST